MENAPTRVLLVDDDEDDYVMTRALLADAGQDRFALDWVSTFEEAEKEIARAAHDVYLIDYRLGRRNGLDLLRGAAERGLRKPMILLTGQGDHEVDLRAMKSGAADYLVKGRTDTQTLERSIRYSLERARHLEALRQAGEELAAARRREVEIASNIQETLLLGRPPAKLPGVQLAVLAIPSERIDGDFQEFFRQDGDAFDVMVGDVMGKGIPAALLGAAAKSQFMRAMSRLLAAGGGQRPEPKDIVTRVHAAMTRQLITLERFVTLCYARFDLKERRVDYVDAGHTPVLHYHGRTGECAWLKSINMPLGFTEGEAYEQHQAPFETGDIFFFYSDGVTEAKSAAGEFFGEERLVRVVRAGHDLDAVDLVEMMRAEVVRFCGREALRDDLTCICVKIEDPGRAAALQRHGELEISSRLDELPTVREFVRSFCAALTPPPDEDKVTVLELGVNEAVSNIMLHAYDRREDRRIRIEADAYPDGTTLRLYHWGRPFEAGPVARPAFDGSRESGFGLYIIALSLDEVRYTRDAQGGNVISLVKTWRPGQGGEAHGTDDGKGW